MGKMKDNFATTREKLHLVAAGICQTVLKKTKGNFLHAKMALGEAAVILEEERKKDAASEPTSDKSPAASE
jgi:hypothetical protein